MFKFLIKGLIRDRSRSIFPILVNAGGVFLVFFGACLMSSFEDNLIANTARYDTGHVKVISRAYKKEMPMKSIELSMESDEKLIDEISHRFPDYRFTRRCAFGALLDIPDENMETRVQAPVAGMAIDFLSPGSVESKDMQIENALVKGEMIKNSGEILLSVQLAEKLEIPVGSLATLFTSSVDGASISANFRVVGIVRFGIQEMDKGSVLMDIAGADELLDMQGYTAELLGFRMAGFSRSALDQTVLDFNEWQKSDQDEYAPVMISLMDQRNMRTLLKTNDFALGIILFIFIFLMAVVLWNAGLVSGIRRWSEIGMRMAIGETRRHIIFTLLVEAFFTGLAGTIVGIILGLPVAYYFQEVGLDYSSELKDISLMMNTVMRARIVPSAFYYSMIPGIFASLLGTLMSCYGVWTRQTAALFKEME